MYMMYMYMYTWYNYKIYIVYNKHILFITCTCIRIILIYLIIYYYIMMFVPLPPNPLVGYVIHTCRSFACALSTLHPQKTRSPVRSRGARVADDRKSQKGSLVRCKIPQSDLYILKEHRSKLVP